MLLAPTGIWVKNSSIEECGQKLKDILMLEVA
jgi:hypothetical protein